MTISENQTSILVAEDDDDDYVFFSMAMEDVEIAVALSRAEDGEVLLRMLREQIPDILFLDLQMPIKSGQECLREIRQDRRYDQLPIIIYSSFADLSHIEHCFREAANLYSIKPDNLRALADVIKRVLLVDWKKMNYFPGRADFVVNPSRSDTL
jgi:CheY-like chemotaxis protein